MTDDDAIDPDASLARMISTLVADCGVIAIWRRHTGPRAIDVSLRTGGREEPTEAQQAGRERTLSRGKILDVLVSGISRATEERKTIEWLIHRGGDGQTCVVVLANKTLSVSLAAALGMHFATRQQRSDWQTSTKTDARMVATMRGTARLEQAARRWHLARTT